MRTTPDGKISTLFDSIRAELEEKKLVVIDRSEQTESENSNIEQEELFSCYYPDGATTSNSGGFDNPSEF